MFPFAFAGELEGDEVRLDNGLPFPNSDGNPNALPVFMLTLTLGSVYPGTGNLRYKSGKLAWIGMPSGKTRTGIGMADAPRAVSIDIEVYFVIVAVPGIVAAGSLEAGLEAAGAETEDLAREPLLVLFVDIFLDPVPGPGEYSVSSASVSVSDMLDREDNSDSPAPTPASTSIEAFPCFADAVLFAAPPAFVGAVDFLLVRADADIFSTEAEERVERDLNDPALVSVVSFFTFDFEFAVDIEAAFFSVGKRCLFDGVLLPLPFPFPLSLAVTDSVSASSSSNSRKARPLQLNQVPLLKLPTFGFKEDPETL